VEADGEEWDMTKNLAPDGRDDGAEPGAGSQPLGLESVRSRATVAGRVAVVGVGVVMVLAAASWLAPRSPMPAASTSPTQLVVVMPQRSYGSPAASLTAAAASPSPLGPNEPWGGLVWSGPVAGDLPWRHVPDQVVSWNGRYVGMDYVGTDNTGDVVVASSPDLATWTVLAGGAGSPFPTGLSGGSAALVVGPAGLVAIGPYGVCNAACATQIWTSADAMSWKPAGRAPFTGTLESVAAGPDGIIAVGSKGFQKSLMWYSETGTNWKPVDLAGAMFEGANIDSVAAVPGGYVALGSVGGQLPPPGVIGDVNSTAAAWWSQDGLTWSAAPVGGSQGATALTGARVMPYGIVATGLYQGVWFSTDGRAWEPLSDRDTRALGQWSDGHHDIAVQFGDPNSVGATSDQFYGSVDGRTWRPLMMTNYPAPVQWYKVFVTAGGVVALAGGASFDDYFVVSAVATR
jgi:hypothetical protein